MTSTDSPSSPYVRHNREAHHDSNAGWTVSLTKIADPKSRRWCAYSFGSIVIFLVFISSTLWMVGFHNNGPFLSNKSSSWIKGLPESVSAVRNPEVCEDPEVESKDPSRSSGSGTPVTASRENIMAIGLTLPGSDPSNIKGDKPGSYPAPTIVPVWLVERNRKSSATASSGSGPALERDPADSANNVNSEVIDPSLDREASNGTISDAEQAPKSDQSSVAKDETKLP
ncbi:hypothetical protein Mapa_014033 [Marchantia paleacea]|nr:hypothetical protein Mapa_014033 [Marchantia paleacea]